MHRRVDSRRVRELVDDCGRGLEALEQRCMMAAPVLMTTGGISEYTEDGIPLPIDVGVTVVDADSPVVAATVRISGGYAAGQDWLVFQDQLGITGSWDASAGTLSLAGSASAAAYQAALRSVSFWNSSDNPSDELRTVSYSVSDGVQSSATRTKLLLVNPDNDAPVIVMSGESALFVAGSGPVVIDAGVRISDVDSDTVWGALVQITGNYAAGEDVLEFTDQLGISGLWDAPSGTLLLVGFASLGEYEQALRTIRYANSSPRPSTFARGVSFEVSDGALPSTPGVSEVIVRARNQAPVLTTSGVGTSYIEDAAPVAVDSGLVVSDDDSAVLVSASVAISSNHRPGEDALVFVDQGGIVGSWDAGSGVLTLSGAASVSAYQAALRSVGYVNLSQDPVATTRVVTVTVSDGTDSSNSVSQVVSVVAINDAPSAASSAGRATFTQGGAAVTVDAGVTVGDVDSPRLAGAVMRISANYAAGQDELVFATQGGISAVWDAASGTLTLSGDGSVAAYQAALRSVQYRNTSASPSTAVRIVSFVVQDSAGAVSAAATREMSVVANPPPPPPPPPPSCPRHDRNHCDRSHDEQRGRGHQGCGRHEAPSRSDRCEDGRGRGERGRGGSVHCDDRHDHGHQGNRAPAQPACPARPPERGGGHGRGR